MRRKAVATQETRKKQAAPSSLAALTTAPGSGLRCDACREPIASSQVECRCAGADGAVARFHQWCYYAKSPHVGGGTRA
jgi:hypothetical protein